MIEIQDAITGLLGLIQSVEECNQQSALRDLLTDALHVAKELELDAEKAWQGANEVFKEETPAIFTLPERPVIICVVEGGVFTGASASIDIEVKVLDLDNDKDDEHDVLDEIENLPHKVY